MSYDQFTADLLRELDALKQQVATLTQELGIAYECPLCAFTDNSEVRAKDGCPNCGVGVSLRRVSWRDRALDLQRRLKSAAPATTKEA